VILEKQVMLEIPTRVTKQLNIQVMLNTYQSRRMSQQLTESYAINSHRG